MPEWDPGVRQLFKQFKWVNLKVPNYLYIGHIYPTLAPKGLRDNGTSGPMAELGRRKPDLCNCVSDRALSSDCLKIDKASLPWAPCGMPVSGMPKSDWSV